MTEPTALDPAALQAAADRLDTLFDEAGKALGSTDQEIAGCADGWKEEATPAFEKFTTYLDNRRQLLQANLAEMSELLRTTNNTLQAQDNATGQALLDQAPTDSSSLNL